MVFMMNDVAIRKVLLKLVGFGEREWEEFLGSNVNRGQKYENNGGAYGLRKW